MTDAQGSVNYTVKELLSMLEKTLTEQIGHIGTRIEEVNRKLDLKASEVRVEKIEREHGLLEHRVISLENRLAGAAAVSTYQRWIFGSVGVGVLGAVATLVWLASGGH